MSASSLSILYGWEKAHAVTPLARQALEPEVAAVSDPTLTPAAVAEAKVVARMRQQRRSFVPTSPQLEGCDLQACPACLPDPLAAMRLASCAASPVLIEVFS